MAGKGRAVGKLFSAGAVLIQHRRMITGLRSVPSDEIRPQLRAYLEDLSPLSRAGFQATLVAMAKAEKPDASGAVFLNTLADPLQEVMAELRDAEAAEPALPPATSPAAAPAGRTTPVGSFDDDLHLVHTWLPLSAQDRRDAVIGHVRPLPVEHHEAFLDHARTMCVNVQADIERHEADESSAWGGFIEDRMAYLNARLSTGQRDPDWVARMQELEAYAALFADVASVAADDLVARAHAAPAGPDEAERGAEQLEGLLDEFTETGVMPDGLLEQLGQIDDPALMDRLLARLKEAGADELGSRPTLEIADHYVDGTEPYSLWWPLAGPGLSLPVPFEELDRPTQFHVLWAEFSFRLTEAGALRNSGQLDEAQAVFQECLERASQLDVGVLKEQAYEGLMTVAERRGDRDGAKRYLHLAQQEHLRTTR